MKGVKVAVLASGSGTNLQALIDEEKRLGQSAAYTIACVIVDRKNTGAESRAKAASIPLRRVLLLDRFTPEEIAHMDAGQKRAARSRMALEVCGEFGVKLIVLAGYLSLLAGPIITEYAGRIINLHPALLPDFGGPGMWGRRVHEAVLAAGRTESGCTVHFVDAGCDTGEIIAQKRCPVLPDDTPETLAARLAPLEHEAIVEAVKSLALRMTQNA
jgi:phosphoribosylglycinamide formyltransferase-1